MCVRLTTCASAAGSQARAPTILRSTDRHRRSVPGRSWGPIRPVGCMRGLGGRLREQRLQTARQLPQRGLRRGLVRSIGRPPHRLNIGPREAERLVS
jgi:hypothetical protein